MLSSTGSLCRFTFDEKFEYWAFVWGTLVMGLTGFMLWNPIVTAKILPGVAIPAALAAHSGEALLAVLAIAIWFSGSRPRFSRKSTFPEDPNDDSSVPVAASTA